MAAAQALDFREFTPGKGSLKAREVIRKYSVHAKVDTVGEFTGQVRAGKSAG